MFSKGSQNLVAVKSYTVLESFTIAKEGYSIFVDRLQGGLQFKVIRESVWFRGQKTDLEDDEIEIALKEFQRGEIDIINKKDFIKLIVKGLTVILNIDKDTPESEKEMTYQKMKITSLEERISSLEQELKDKNSSNILWVTVHRDNTRRSYNKGDIAIKFEVNKKKKTSILLIQGTLCVKGESNAETCGFWTYGEKTVAYGQTEQYMNNSGYGRAVTTNAVIMGHDIVGPQQLSLSWHPSMLPFTIINPNNSDHSQYYDMQTESVFTVWEINQ